MLIDSSVWLEILREGSLAPKCQRAMARQIIQVPSLVLYEVYKKIRQKVSEDVALEAISALSRYEILDLTREVALLGADLSLQYELAMADALVLAHAAHLGTDLLTLDNDFASIPNVQIVR
jgi:predicted nucleic acid-binding protein